MFVSEITAHVCVYVCVCACADMPNLCSGARNCITLFISFLFNYYTQSNIRDLFTMKSQDEEEAVEPVAEVTSEQPPSSPMHQRRIESVSVTSSLYCCYCMYTLLCSCSV